MNFQELKAKIEDIGISDVAYEDFDEKELPLKLVHSVGGGEGGGEYVERVFEHAGIFVKLTGYYASYSGTDWDEDVVQVFPKQKTITVYEPS
jgi:hypothetical protein